jgi:drug/metabolite transporter (DMT)-like permease
MAARELAGMTLMAFAGLGLALLVILDSVVKRHGFPYAALFGSASICLGLVLACFTWSKGLLAKLTSRQWMWVVMRGTFGSSTYVLTLLAVITGAPLGDASALQSTNVVAAAVLGRAFLGETLRALHVCALGFSMVGAVIISRPQALFGAPTTGGTAWLGCALALAAGAASGGSFIAARKSQDVSPLIMTTSVCFQEGLSMCLLFALGLVRDPPLSAIYEAPWSAAIVFAALVLAIALASCTLSAGAQMCPAALASTVFTSMNMSLCFAAQALLDDEVLDALSLLGAGLLLLGVALMALARSWYSADTSDTSSRRPEVGERNFDATADPRISEGIAQGRSEEADEIESLANFIASEFSGLSPESLRRERGGGSGARQRRTHTQAVHPAAEVLGAASA